MIKNLSDETISQISAGEVVERPSNMIKELVENALDAGAKHIEIDFAQGGRFVKVKDDGSGIPKQELPLALARHATSKIQNTQDLWSLNSFGFRGEALASIASVSQLSLISGVKGQKSYQIQSHFGKEQNIEDSHESQGSTVIVRSLFENTPARFKFLKSDGVENSAIKNTLKALALSHPEIHFKILQKGKMIFYWPPQADLTKRAYQVLSASELYFTKEQRGAYKIQAVLSPPHITLKNKKNNWFFVQNRWVESRVIQAALMSAYRGLLMHGEYPLALIKIEGPPDEIDVNVHPTKSQIRFKNSSGIFKLVESPLRALLEQAPWTKKITQTRFGPAGANPLGANQPEATQFGASQLGTSQLGANQFGANPLDKSEQNLQWNQGSFQKTHWKQSPKAPGYSSEQLSELAWAIPSPLLKNHPQNSNPREYKQEYRQKTEAGTWSHLQVLSQAHLTYIVCQSDRGLVFIDQHAGHERILYERIFRSWKQGSVQTQRRLIPLVLDLEEGQSTALLELKTDLEKIGLEIALMGPQSVGIQAGPAILKDKALHEGLLFLAKNRIETGDSFSFENVISNLCATLACHSAIRAGQSLGLDQMEELLKQMDEFPLSSFCPHGRPVFVEYPISKLEKDFGRIP